MADKEHRVYAGKCTCGKCLQMRISTESDDEAQVWIVYGFCTKCKVVYAMGIYMEQPIDGVDYSIDYNKVVEASKKDPFGDKK